MNILNMFEERAGAIFGESPSGQTTPFSFKKLAKRAVRAMEHEVYIINDVDTAPALYTVLVSQTDAQIIQPLYTQLAHEAAQFIKSQAQKKGYAFVGEPLFRFIPDPALKSGKFSVFAENVDLNTLNRLIEEERSFLGGQAHQISQQGVPLRQAAPSHPSPASQTRLIQTPQAPAQEYAENEMGLTRMPDDLSPLGNAPVASPTAAAPDASVQLVAPAVSAAMSAAITSDAATDEAPNTPDTSSVVEESNDSISNGSATCLLIDQESGRTYTVTAPRAIIGRERTVRGIVLHDPNVSRQHAELTYEDNTWHIRDLNSTNGTLINDVDIDECILQDGDLITVGMSNLEFKGD